MFTVIAVKAGIHFFFVFQKKWIPDYYFGNDGKKFCKLIRQKMLYSKFINA